MKTKNYSAALVLSLLPLSVMAETYVGLGIGKADHSKYTVADMEHDSLTITKNKNHPTAWNIYVGQNINEYLSAEMAYMNLGKKKVSGTDSGAFADTSIGIDGVAMSLLAGKRFNGVKPYVRLGLMYERQKRKEEKSGNAATVFQNPNSDYSTTTAVRPLFGLGIEADLSQNLAVRLDYSVIKNAYVDYINNIDHGGIKRDASIALLGLHYKFDNMSGGSSLGDGKWSMGLAGGWSRTSARMTGGNYNGNLWNLQTNTISTQVSGDMSDDKSNATYRLSFFRDDGSFEYELYLAMLGEFKSRSTVDGVTGGGAALTGASTRTANALGASVGYQFEPVKSLSVIPKLGLAAVHTRDEIYNNLDFGGVGGTERGPVVKKTVLSPTVGLVVGYQLTKSIEARLGYEHYFQTGTNATLGKGNISTVSAGIKVGL